MNAKWICPAITPFCADGTIDYESAARFYEHLIANEIDGVLIGGSLGEFFWTDAYTARGDRAVCR